MHSLNIHVHFYMYTDMKVSHKSNPVSRVNFTFYTSETFFLILLFLLLAYSPSNMDDGDGYNRMLLLSMGYS